MVTAWKQIIAADMRKVMREPFFWFILLMPPLMGWGLNSLLPYLTGQFQNIDLSAYYPLIIALFILTPPLYYGLVLALQILDEKGERVLLAVAVTPIRLPIFLSARILVYTAISMPLIVVVHNLIGIIPISTGKLMWVALAASLNTPLMVMLLAALANNQLEAFVIGKGLGFIILFPLAMFFVPDYWHLICGILPTYWPIIAYFTAVNESGSDLFFAFAIAMALITQPLATVLLYRKFAGSLQSE